MFRKSVSSKDLTKTYWLVRNTQPTTTSCYKYSTYWQLWTNLWKLLTNILLLPILQIQHLQLMILTQNFLMDLCRKILYGIFTRFQRMSNCPRVRRRNFPCLISIIDIWKMVRNSFFLFFLFFCCLVL